MSLSDNVKNKISRLFEGYFSRDESVEVISFATTDGFPVCEFARGKSDFDPQMMAAAASTLYSVSNAVSQQILSMDFKISFIESEQGNVAFVALQLGGKDFVLSMSANKVMNIASLRMLINRLAGEISALDTADVA